MVSLDLPAREVRRREYFSPAPMSTLKNMSEVCRRADAANQTGVSGAMLIAWARRTMPGRTKRMESGSARVCAPIVSTLGASNPTAAPDFICANYQQWIRHIENIQRCR
jgi:hypothetical protein